MIECKTLKIFQEFLQAETVLNENSLLYSIESGGVGFNLEPSPFKKVNFLLIGERGQYFYSETGKDENSIILSVKKTSSPSKIKLKRVESIHFLNGKISIG